jgi:hypothetical protein
MRIRLHGNDTALQMYGDRLGGRKALCRDADEAQGITATE